MDEKKKPGRKPIEGLTKCSFKIKSEAMAIVDSQGVGNKSKYVEDAIFFYTLYKDKIKQEH